MSNEQQAPVSPPQERTSNGRGTTNLKTFSLSGLEDWLASRDEPSFRAEQIFTWIYGKGVTDFAGMTNLPKDLRKRLAQEAEVPLLKMENKAVSHDGTIKCLFRLPSGRPVESVLIPKLDENDEVERLTVCVSSQVGCALGCSFCATGKMGFRENLTPGAIFDQVWFMNRIARRRYDRRITNIVFMGMGEPLMNLDSVLGSIDILSHPKSLHISPRRITISTVGLARRIKQLADADSRSKLAVSLHAPTNEKRSSIMPVNRAEKTDLSSLRSAIEYYYDRREQPVTYEYCLFRDFNDTVEDAHHLAEISRWVPSKVNLMMYNEVAGTGFDRTSEQQLERFIQTLVDEDVVVTVRRSRGDDIDAACGQLASDA